jgi:hypothetical protein
MVGGKTPDLTTAQLVAIIGGVLAPIIARLGFDVSPATLSAILQAVAIGGGALVLGDAHVRHGRARGLGHAADRAASSEPAAGAGTVTTHPPKR